MRLTAQIIQTVLAAIVLCFSATAVKTQPERKPGNSSIRGTVVYSDTGRPLRHARVSLFGVGDQREHDSVTDLRGRFGFTDLPAGRYQIRIEAPGILQSETFVPRIAATVQHRLLPSRVEFVTEVILNGTDSIDLKLQAVRGGVITGRVVTEDDQPVIDADIKLLRRENGKWVPDWTTWSNPFGDKPGLKTDAGGVYRIAGLRSGEYLVRVSEPTLGDDGIPGDEDSYSLGSFMVAYYPAATSVKDAQAVSVTVGNESTGIDIRMPERASHTLTGTVTFASDNMPGAFVEVTIERNDEIGYTRATRESTTRTDNEGKWQVAGLPPGEYLVTIGGSVLVTTAGRADRIETPLKRTPVRIRDKKITVLNTTISAGAQLEGRVILNGKAIEDSSDIYARVEPVTRTPAPDGAEDYADESRFRPGFVRQGRFEITGLPPGTYWFLIEMREGDAPAVYVKSVTRKGVDLMQTSVKLTDNTVFDDVVVTLATDLASVEGQVTLPEGPAKQSLSDVIVVIVPANDVTRRFGGGTRTMQPGARGKLTFTSAPGEYFITALTKAQYDKLAPQLNYEYFDKNAEVFQRLKLRAGEKTKGLTLQIADK